MVQAEKFSSLQDSDDDDSVMDEDSLLETPLDKMEPYSVFRDSLLSTPKGDVVVR
jgi:importin-7